MQEFDAIVVGQGYAGLTAAKLAAKRGLRVASIEQMFAGGLVMNVNELDPAPSGGAPSGPELTANLAMANMDRGIENINETVELITQRFDAAWVIKTTGGEYTAPHAVVATGATLRKLSVPGEDTYIARGISNCADCDGPFFQDRDVVVVGGGDSAFQEALALVPYANQITIVVRGPAAVAREDLLQRADTEPKVRLLTDTSVTEILGDGDRVTAVRVDSDGREATIQAAGVFVLVGLEPNNAFLPVDIERDGDGAVLVDQHGQTSRPGLWAVGAVRSGFGGLLEHAEADAALVIGALT